MAADDLASGEEGSDLEAEVGENVRDVTPRAWLLGCVRGSAGGYRRGTVTLRRLRTHVVNAVAQGVAIEELLPVLAQHRLRWDADSSAVLEGPPTQDASAAPGCVAAYCPVCGASLIGTASNRTTNGSNLVSDGRWKQSPARCKPAARASVRHWKARMELRLL